jgi:acetyltransferase-like isoleucine patch superfamily enzyme
VKFSASKNLLGKCAVEFYDVLRSAIILGEHARIGDDVTMRGRISIGKYSVITDYAQLYASETSPIRIGNFCSIAPNAFIIGYSYHDTQMLTTSTSLA